MSGLLTVPRSEDQLMKSGSDPCLATEGSIRDLLVEKPLDQENIGFNLMRSQWDPYPWVQSVDSESAAEAAGLKEGDCLLRAEDQDLLGLKVCEVARLVRCSGRELRLLVWSRGLSPDLDPEALALGPCPLALRRLGACLERVLRAQQCPVCTGTVAPPALQCPRGHLLCRPCRAALPSPPLCPMCRVPLPSQLRNLLADEVYSSVVEVFNLRADCGRLSQRLFGDAFNKAGDKAAAVAAAIAAGSSQGGFPAHDGPPSIKQRLLQRLLPGRARSTGNISRAGGVGGRRSGLAEDRDLSRSLNTLDTASVILAGSMDSLACTAGGSCNSLPPLYLAAPVRDTTLSSTPGFVDESESALDVPTTSDSLETSGVAVLNPADLPRGFHCAADPTCRQLVEDDMQQHVLMVHGHAISLTPSSLGVSWSQLTERQNNTFSALLHSSGTWFYPKCERDESGRGVHVWCWALACSSVSSEYQINVEVWNNIKEDNNIIQTNSYSSNGRTSGVIRSELENNNNHMRSSETLNNEKDDLKNSNIINKSSVEIIISQNDSDNMDNSENISDNNFMKANDLEMITDDFINEDTGLDEKDVNGPLLRLAAPVLSLRSVSWNKVLASRQALFLSYGLLPKDAILKLTVPHFRLHERLQRSRDDPDLKEVDSVRLLIILLILALSSRRHKKWKQSMEIPIQMI